ncbi:UDP-N-acetylmuramoyl-tripeptide--D-alanyl-D-alanine ligase [Allosphingosinicella deserti]|uniref:UDP-N-acetylmuramoyl-tripeptide--D-alanyl-D-alanine ligase n=1 Tax=Allosphingosinicella deserti TaxID=2116704 RepID=A0A2P7QKV9_9SPHN|nr:UDP-N-acetylmuramoyl-tripeptide--D-alanyl-D-alanine ligase [Sphingomonas deserti]PSJ38592.1 UDP-N-acetylmuramoylalanyl-D-glutamyl-2, 6-diaminopimelate--D-alanyl-D-alanine ligase [Sphingomonas deserti]
MTEALWTADEIAAATSGTATGDFAASGVAFDSREVAPGHLFLALKGEATDGHLFLDRAFAAGAAGAVVSQPIEQPHVLVADTTAALNDLGRASRARSAARICGVTGSVGKTGTKEALFAALDRSAPGEAHRSVKSYNNHTGVPLSLARMPREARFGVFEMGMNHAGELAALTRLVRPHVAIVTAIAPAHREFFASDEEIADAKGEIFQGLEEGGVALVPFDSAHRDRLIAAARPHAARILTFGFGDGADIRAKDVVGAPGGGSLVTAMLPDASLTFTIAQHGEHWVSNALAVLGAVEALGGDLAAAGLAFADMPGLKGRGERHRVAAIGGEALLIDESYNANPVSMAATLKTFGAEKVSGRRIAVLGAMRELGASSEDFHVALAEPIVAAKVDLAILVGPEMAPLAKALGRQIKMAHVPDAASAIELVQDEFGPGDAILVKGSNSIGLATLVEALASGKR